ncbi:MAG: hypothetical protein ABJN14_09995 [Paracoccaceae bacterium]
MVSGLLKFEKLGAVASFQFVLVYIEDTRRAGADATLVAEHRIDIPPNFDLARDVLPFEFQIDQTLDGLTVRAHMPAHDGRDIRSGDMITMGSFAASNSGNDVVILKSVR